MTIIQNEAIVLFQGDSITDSGRGNGKNGDMGLGYPMIIEPLFSLLYPEKNVKFINRGVSGTANGLDITDVLNDGINKKILK